MSMKNWNYENEQWQKLPAHLKHLPLFTRHFDFSSYLISTVWSVILKNIGFRLYVRLKVVGDFHEVYKKHPKLLLISNHSSHLDATSIAAAVPFKYWKDLFISAAKDYWFRNPIFTFFSQHCLGAIPIDRKEKKSEAVKLCISLLNDLDRIWLILFPEGTRSQDGYLQNFKKGVSLFSQTTNTPILFLYIQGNADLWPKERLLPKPGKLTLHVGPVVQPGPIEEIQKAYEDWLFSIDPSMISDEKRGNERV